MENIITVLRESTFTIFFILGILLLTFVVQRIVSKLLSRSFAKSSRILKVDPTHYRFFQHLTSAVIFIMGIGIAIYSVPSLRALSVSLFAGAGILAIIVGFASQQVFANVVSGIFITIFKPFRVGDRIRVGPEVKGIVEDINLRHVVVRDIETKRIIIVPNTLISSQNVENATLGSQKLCNIIDFSVSYDTHLDKAMKIMEEEALKHPSHIDNRTHDEVTKKEPIVPVRVIGLTDSGITLRTWVWAADPETGFTMSCDLYKNIKERFDSAGIEIPYPHRTIVYKNARMKNT
ncbi:mechanosensitive ion channel family protein [Candidatus Woesearchaeota archaeon]|nr:mechanosensitive ion channel family protein [Candidatus Woesearchaeota archaeon]